MTTTAAARRSPVTCEPAAELLALGAMRAVHALRCTPPRRLPNGARCLTCVGAISDRVVPVPREWLGMPATAAGANARVVEAGREARPVGFVLDTVGDVAAVEAWAEKGGADV